MDGKYCGDCVYTGKTGKICIECLDSGTMKNFKQLPECVEVPAEKIEVIKLGGSNR